MRLLLRFLTHVIGRCACSEVRELADGHAGVEYVGKSSRGSWVDECEYVRKIFCPFLLRAEILLTLYVQT